MDRHRNSQRPGPYHGEPCQGGTALSPPSCPSPRSRDDSDAHTVGTSTPGAAAALQWPGPVLRACASWALTIGASPAGPEAATPTPARRIPSPGVTCEPASELCALMALGLLKRRRRGGQMGRRVSPFCGLTRRTPPGRPRPPSLCRLVVGSWWQSQAWDPVRGGGTQPRARRWHAAPFPRSEPDAHAAHTLSPIRLDALLSPGPGRDYLAGEAGASTRSPARHSLEVRLGDRRLEAALTPRPTLATTPACP